jgi:hypothetical protein
MVFLKRRAVASRVASFVRARLVNGATLRTCRVIAKPAERYRTRARTVARDPRRSTDHILRSDAEPYGRPRQVPGEEPRSSIRLRSDLGRRRRLVPLRERSRAPSLSLSLYLE